MSTLSLQITQSYLESCKRRRITNLPSLSILPAFSCASCYLHLGDANDFLAALGRLIVHAYLSGTHVFIPHLFAITPLEIHTTVIDTSLSQAVLSNHGKHARATPG